MKINIEDGFCAILEKRAKEQGYGDCEEYINFVLKQIVDKISSSPQENNEVYSEEDQKKIKQRLQSLGYID